MNRKIYFFLFLSLFLLSSLYTQGQENETSNEYPTGEVGVFSAVQELFSDNIREKEGTKENDYAVDVITKILSETFDATWKTFESRKNLIKDPDVLQALENLRIKVKNGTKKIDIDFDLSGAYQDYYKKNFFIIFGGEKLAWHWPGT